MYRRCQTSILLLIFVIGGVHELQARQTAKTFNGFRATQSPTPCVATQIFEAENLRRTATGGTLSVQDMRSFGKWSANKQLFWAGGQVRHQLEFQISKSTQTRESVTLHLTQAPDFANLRFRWNGKELKPGFDGYAPAVKLAKRSLGTLDFQRGVNTLSLVIVGKNPKSSNFRVGIDRIDIGSRPVTTMTPNLKGQAKKKLAFNPNLVLGANKKGKKPSTKPSGSEQSRPINPNMQVFNMAKIFPPGVELFFNRGGSPEFAYSLDPTEVNPNSPDKHVDFYWNGDKLPNAKAILWQVSKNKIPAYSNSKQALQPAGIVGSGYAPAPTGLQRGKRNGDRLSGRTDFTLPIDRVENPSDGCHVRAEER